MLALLLRSALPRLRLGRRAVYGNRTRLGAGHEADAASRASRARVLRRAIAVVVQALAHADHFGRACLNAQPAALALRFVHAEHSTILLFRTHCGFLPSAGARARRNIVPHGEAAYLHEDRKYGPTMSWGSGCDRCHPGRHQTAQKAHSIPPMGQGNAWKPAATGLFLFIAPRIRVPRTAPAPTPESHPSARTPHPEMTPESTPAQHPGPRSPPARSTARTGCPAPTPPPAPRSLAARRHPRKAGSAAGSSHPPPRIRMRLSRRPVSDCSSNLTFL